MKAYYNIFTDEKNYMIVFDSFEDKSIFLDRLESCTNEIEKSSLFHEILTTHLFI